jgi:hypothetical protein
VATGAEANEVASALIWAADNDESEPIPPALFAIAVWMRVVVAPAFLDDAKGP